MNRSDALYEKAVPIPNQGTLLPPPLLLALSLSLSVSCLDRVTDDITVAMTAGLWPYVAGAPGAVVSNTRGMFSVRSWQAHMLWVFSLRFCL